MRSYWRKHCETTSEHKLRTYRQNKLRKLFARLLVKKIEKKHAKQQNNEHHGDTNGETCLRTYLRKGERKYKQKYLRKCWRNTLANRLATVDEYEGIVVVFAKHVNTKQRTNKRTMNKKLGELSANKCLHYLTLP